MDQKHTEPPPQQHLQQQRLLTKREVAGRLSVSLRQVDRLVAAFDLPAPLKVGKRASRWREEDLAAYIARLAR